MIESRQCSVSCFRLGAPRSLLEVEIRVPEICGEMSSRSTTLQGAKEPGVDSGCPAVAKSSGNRVWPFGNFQSGPALGDEG